jgi:hypothetical protein
LFKGRPSFDIERLTGGFIYSPIFIPLSFQPFHSRWARINAPSSVQPFHGLQVHERAACGVSHCTTSFRKVLFLITSNSFFVH